MGGHAVPESSFLTAADVRAALRDVLCPGTRRDIVAVDLVGGITVDGEDVTVEILHTTEKAELIQEVQKLAAERVGSLRGAGTVEVVVKRPEGAPAPNRPAKSPDPWAERQPIPHVKHIVAVASAKGGVGKSSVAVNLALALSEQDYRVGLLDADVYGPSVPAMLSITDVPEVTPDRKLLPVTAHGIQIMSIGFWLDPTQPVVWRGPMVFSQIKQFLRDVLWPELDYLIVDLPPGTGDAQLTLIQQVPLAGVVMVTTPQEIALTDVRRGIQMFRSMKMQIPVLGVVENMSRFVCPDTGKSYFIFGRGGGASVAQQFNVPLLAEIPLDVTIREGADDGRPAMENPDSPARTAFLDLAAKIVQAVV
jgi:ATP-binding protein involved in chromosome partitioning